MIRADLSAAERALDIDARKTVRKNAGDADNPPKWRLERTSTKDTAEKTGKSRATVSREAKRGIGNESQDETGFSCYCITTISIFADRPRPSFSETTATVIGETMPGPSLWLHTCSMPESECRETLTDPFEPMAMTYSGGSNPQPSMNSETSSAKRCWSWGVIRRW